MLCCSLHGIAWCTHTPCMIMGHSSASWSFHYTDVIMRAIASQITSLTSVYSTVYSDADKRKHQSSASLAFVRGIHRGPVNSLHKWSVTRKMFRFDDVIMQVVYIMPMMTLLNGNISALPVDSPTKARDAKLWCFLWSAPEQMVKQTIETPVIWDAMAFIITSL